MQPTQKIYETEPFCREFDACVLACEPGQQPDTWEIALDRTAFFPEGGGQPADTGLLNGHALLGLRAQAVLGGEVIWHTLGSPLMPGAAVHGAVDWPARLDHMEQHTGEHILSGTLHRLYGAANVGFHIGEPAVRMDVDLPLDAVQLAQAEAQANAVVRADVPVRCWYPEPEALAALDYRSKKELTGPVRLVEVPGADLCACCGTHLAHSGQVGLIKILSAQNYKGGIRLAVACGGRALRAVSAEQQDARAAGSLLSAASGSLAPAVRRLLEAQAAQKQCTADLQNSLANALAAAAVPGQRQILLLHGPDGDGLRRICLTLTQTAEALCVIFAPGGQGLAYAMAGPKDVRPVCRALNAAFGGRGGGKPGFCQGSLANTNFDAAKGFLENFTPTVSV